MRCSQKKSDLSGEIRVEKQQLHEELQKGEVEMSFVHVETRNSQLATRNLPIELAARSTLPSEGACTTAAERFQNHSLPIYSTTK